MFPFPSGLIGVSGFGPSLDPTAASANATLSNNNRRATAGGANSWYGARSVLGRRSGKVYIEATCVSQAGPGDVRFGLAQANSSMNGLWDSGGNTSVRTSASSAAITGATSGATGSAWGVGQVACMAADIDGNLIWYRSNGGNWNNSGTANPATGVGGLSIAALTTRPLFLAVLLYTGGAIDVNFGQSAFVYTPPSGFVTP